MGILFFIVVSLILTIPSYLFSGYVLMKLWSWFIVPTFSTEPISYVAAAGITLIIGFLTHKRSSTNDDDGSLSSAYARLFLSLVEVFLVGLTALLLGAILKSQL